MLKLLAAGVSCKKLERPGCYDSFDLYKGLLREASCQCIVNVFYKVLSNIFLCKKPWEYDSHVLSPSDVELF